MPDLRVSVRRTGSHARSVEVHEPAPPTPTATEPAPPADDGKLLMGLRAFVSTPDGRVIGRFQFVARLETGPYTLRDSAGNEFPMNFFGQ